MIEHTQQKKNQEDKNGKEEENKSIILFVSEKIKGVYKGELEKRKHLKREQVKGKKKGKYEKKKRKRGKKR